MTLENYEAATAIVARIQELNNSICDINHILQTSNTAEWLMEIRPSKSHSLNTIDHKGLLPTFLNMVLTNLCEERAELKKKLEEL